MPEMTYRAALQDALRSEMARDQDVILMGEEIGIFEGSYKITAGLLAEFGPTASGIRRSPRKGRRCRHRRRHARPASGGRDNDHQLQSPGL